MTSNEIVRNVGLNLALKGMGSQARDAWCTGKIL